MRDWNVVATAHDRGFRRACELLGLGGKLSRTDFYSVVVMKVDDVEAFLGWLEQQWNASPHFSEVVAHVRPAREAFDFRSADEFRANARARALPWVPELEGRSFHVRIHRRGFQGRLSARDEERSLADALLEHLSTKGGIRFEDPDAIVAVDTVGERAGMSLWNREELQKFSFLGLVRSGKEE